jgi:DNA polymerase III delta' subunit
MLTFTDILGQPAAVEFLRAAALSDRLPHALLFTGPLGVGKRSCADALAAWFLCQNPRGAAEASPSADPCGVCPSCRLIAAGNHPDHHVITKELIRYHDKTGKSKATVLAVDVIKEELVARAGHTSVMGRGKFFVVEQAELMNPHAQNAMLKTLEEPAGRTVIVLLSESPEFLLPTIRSRCQLVRFGTLPTELIRQKLEKQGIEPEIAAEAADLSDGSLGGAMRLIQEQILPAARQLQRQIDDLIASAEALPSAHLPGDIPALFKQAADAYAERQLEKDPLSSKEFATRDGLALYLNLAFRQFRRRLRQTSESDQLERTCCAIDAIARCQMYLDANVNVPVALGQLAAAWMGEFAAA